MGETFSACHGGACLRLSGVSLCRGGVTDSELTQTLEN